MEPVPVPGTGSERDILLACLRNQRAAILWKVEGLTTDQAWERHLPSPLTLAGLVRHLALVEKGWIFSFAGLEFDHGYDFDADPDAEFRHDPSVTLEQAIEEYRHVIAEVDAIIANADLDDISATPRRRTGERLSLRWIVVHLIEELARHAGHADILRELTDGATGYLPTETYRPDDTDA